MCFLQEEELKKAILVVFANKQDMEQAMTPTEVANALGLPALKDRKWQIFKTSATKGIGLEEAMEWYVMTRHAGRTSYDVSIEETCFPSVFAQMNHVCSLASQAGRFPQEPTVEAPPLFYITIFGPSV